MPRTAAKHLSIWLTTACALALLLCSASPATATSLSIRVQKRDGKPLSGAVLTLESQSQRLPPVAPVSTVIDQLNLSFVPDVVVIPVGSAVSFPNSDAVSHQVYSFSSARRFQLPLYRGKPYPPVSFDQPGLITLGCNIHDNMLAYIIVTAAPFFGRTDANGEWVSANVPMGTYRVKVWHPLLNESGSSVERAFEVRSDARTEVVLRLARALRPSPIASRPHSWDY
jgi:plastocyanin